MRGTCLRDTEATMEEREYNLSMEINNGNHGLIYRVDWKPRFTNQGTAHQKQDDQWVFLRPQFMVLRSASLKIPCLLH